MLALNELLESLPTAPAVGELLAGFVPPPRFGAKHFDNYVPDARHPSQRQAQERLRSIAARLRRDATARGRFRGLLKRRSRGAGIYLDGGFGVGKTHLLAALWHAAPQPSLYLSFDELVYTIGLLGLERVRSAFGGQHLVAVDEWELDDPGNLKLALAWLRGALADGLQVAVTSNTIPDELGRGRFSQKSFAAEIEELASAFEVVRVEGDDFRHRHFDAEPGREFFRSLDELERVAAGAGGGVLLVPFTNLLDTLGRIHPIRYADLVSRLQMLLIDELAAFEQLPAGLRWVHFIDKLYDSAVPLAASARIPLAQLFPGSFLSGAYGKKFSRCLSRMEELLGEFDESPEVLPGYLG